MKIQITGIGWYKEENYSTALKIFDDRDKLPKTYKEWFAKANDLKQKLEAEGMEVVCVDIDPDIFTKWCKDKKLKLDAKARTEYANEGAYLAYMKKGN
jgi:hypothetical protein